MLIMDKKTNKNELKLYVFYFKDNEIEWVQPIIANSAREAKKLGYQEWFLYDDYINSRVNKIKTKVDITELHKGCLNLFEEEYIKRNIGYYVSEDEDDELSENTFYFRIQ